MAVTTHAPSRVPARVNSERDGIVVSSGPVTVDAYIDFQCPYCRAFEESSGPAVHTMAADGLITLVYHPLGFLDRLSTTRYSSRAASASGCASDGDSFIPYLEALFANQPPEGGAGLSDEALAELGRAVGLGPEFDQCVLAHAYVPWVDYVTDRAIARGVSGTPTVMVEGVPVPASARIIAEAVTAAAR
jgi:protein-disulfide isomerase